MIETLCERDIGFRVIGANQAPDHTTVSRFRKENGEVSKLLFTQVLKLCKEAGLVKMHLVALDGSKIAANAALEANRTYAHIQGEAERRLRVEKMLSDAQAQDEVEDRRYGVDKRGCVPRGRWRCAKHKSPCQTPSSRAARPTSPSRRDLRPSLDGVENVGRP